MAPKVCLHNHAPTSSLQNFCYFYVGTQNLFTIHNFFEKKNVYESNASERPLQSAEKGSAKIGCRELYREMEAVFAACE